MLDRLVNNSNSGETIEITSDQHNDMMHHLIDKHHNDHDCHMTAHLIGLNSNAFNIAALQTSQQFTSFNLPISTLKIAPPSKPPRA